MKIKWIVFLFYDFMVILTFCEIPRDDLFSDDFGFKINTYGD
jgi:hypothetical protein